MKSKATTILIVILILNLIIPKIVLAEYPTEIEGISEKESMDTVLNSSDPGLTNDLSDSGQTTLHPGTSTDGEDKVTIRDEVSTVQNTPSSGGGLVSALVSIANIFPTIISNVLTFIVYSDEPKEDVGDITENGKIYREFTIQNLIYGDYTLFDIDFFTVDEDAEDANGVIKKQVAIWYSITTRLAIIISLCTLIYIGIRMALSTMAVSKVKYKKMLISWFTAFCLIFVMHYIILFAISVSKAVISILPQQEQNIENLIIHGNGEIDNTGLLGEFSNKKGWNLAMPCIMYFVLVYYQVKFFFLYMKRLLSTAFLMMIAPLVTITYPIDKAGDNKAQAYMKWMKEILVNIFVQPLHVILYVVFVASAAEIAKTAPLLAIIFFAALSRGEKIVKNLFDIRNLSSINSIGTKKT